MGLFDIYLSPLQKETFLSKDEVRTDQLKANVCVVRRQVVSHSVASPQMEALFGSLPEMLDFQRVFLQTLEERIAACPDFSSLETPEQFKVRIHQLLLLVQFHVQSLFYVFSIPIIRLILYISFFI